MPDNLNGVMRSATENLNPNIGKLTAGGIERGVRKRRNRRIAQIVGTAAGVTAVFGAVAVANVPGHGASATVSAGSGTPTAPASTPDPAKPPVPAVSGDDMVAALRQVLAPYQFTDEKVEDKAGTEDIGGPHATMQIGYPAGIGSLSVFIQHMAYQNTPVSGGYSTVQTLHDGSHVVIYNGPEWPEGNGDPAAKRLDVSWFRNDGVAISIEVLNEAQEKGATTATGLGLTPAEATNAVESGVWDKAIAAVAAKPVPSGDRSKLLEKKAGGGSPASSPASGPASSPASSPAAPPAR